MGLILFMKDGNGGISYSTLLNQNNGANQKTIPDKIRPIVYLKSNLRTTGKDENGAWVISEE